MTKEELIEADDISREEASWLKQLGPGLITGAADDDPSGIATYSQAGASFNFGMVWTIFLTYPLMVAIQIISARLGRVTGHGLASNIRKHYPAPLLAIMVALLLVANIINIAADLAAMGDAVQLVVGGPSHLYAVAFGLLSAGLQILIPYGRYVRVLKWLTLALLSYIGTAFVVDVPWAKVLSDGISFPRLPWSPEYITTVVAILGTTISPYLFFWQASQEVEELLADPQATALKKSPRKARAGFRRIATDTYVGMGVSNAVAFFIMVTAAVSLHAHGIHEIQSSADAAAALTPVAGHFASLLFSFGIIGTGMLAIPVLAGSAAYATSGMLKWKSSLNHDARTAPGFYSVIGIATVLGVILVFAPVEPIKALYWSAVLNGVISVPIMVIMMLMASRIDVMGRLVIRGRLKFFGWLCTGAMAIAVLAMAFTHVSLWEAF